MTKPINQELADNPSFRAEDAVGYRFEWVISMEVDDSSRYITHVMELLELRLERELT